MYYPTYQQYLESSKTSRIVPVSFEMNTDTETPISLFKKFRTDQYCYLFESVEGGERWARYSFMGRNPLMVFKTKDERTELKIQDKSYNFTHNPLNILKNLLNEYKSDTFSYLPRFYGGVVGYFGYDLIRYYENLPKYNPDDLNMPECHLFVPEEIVVYDHLKQKTYIIINTIVEDSRDQYYQAVSKIESLLEELFDSKTQKQYAKGFHVECEEGFQCSMSKQEYCESVSKAKEYIHDGDIFQVVLSQRLKAKYEGDPFNVYRVLRTLNPSPYMYYLQYEDYCIAGASPEMLVRLEDNLVETCPIAGTRPRGKDIAEDDVLAKELMNDEKEKAEHTMLVDLGRNDVGKVSKFGSVRVHNPMHIEKYSHVMHLVTNVTGEKHEAQTPIDVLTALLPAGTVSGAPKVRAMEIIEELENIKRGVYAGAIGYIGFDGNLDTCIAIRTAIFKDNHVYIQAGAGIVADSIPEKEYEETINKAQALMTAIKKAGEIR